MSFWDKINKDIQASFKDGLNIIKEKTELLTDEGKKRYKVFELKSKLQSQIEILGKMVYNLSAIGLSMSG